MRPNERRETRQTNLFRSRLDQIVDPTYALVKLARALDWRFLEQRFGAVYEDGPGRPPLATRLMAARQGPAPARAGPQGLSLHAPEVECIGKGKAHWPHEFGVKVSVATPLHRCRGGQFVAHVGRCPATMRAHARDRDPRH